MGAAESINRFFQQFEQEIDPNVHVVMIWDQVGYHCSKQLRLGGPFDAGLVHPTSSKRLP